MSHRRRLAVFVLGASAGLQVASAARAAEPAPGVLSDGFGFVQQDGEALYRAICQACHMADGRGAQGAGRYPALAGNPRLAAADYVPQMVVRGRKAMPPLGRLLSDEQVAAVSNYVRHRFGAASAGDVTAADVQALRGADHTP